MRCLLNKFTKNLLSLFALIALMWAGAAAAQGFPPRHAHATILYGATGDPEVALLSGRSRLSGGRRNLFVYGSGADLRGAIRYGPSSVLFYDADGDVTRSIRLRRRLPTPFGLGAQLDPALVVRGLAGPEIACRFGDCFPRNGLSARALPVGAFSSRLDFGRYAGGVGRY